MSLYGTIAVVLGGFGLVVIVGIAGLIVRFHLGRRRVEQEWASVRPLPITDMGTVKHLSVLPLIDRRPSREGLSGEAGVSYLVRADDTTILFDSALNQRNEHPSPLLRNMQALGVSVEQVKHIVISHLHMDHVGGLKYQRGRTFNLSAEAVDLRATPVYVPTPMTHPSAQVHVVNGPRVISPGVATLGPIPKQLFFFGRTLEQSLAIDVQGKGLVLIIGCGHPSLERIVRHAEKVLGRPVHGIVGGLHYPVTALPLQRFLGTNNWPWHPARKQDVSTSIAFLQQRHPHLVAVSPHDSCDWTIESFRQAFPNVYRDLLVGQEIAV